MAASVSCQGPVFNSAVTARESAHLVQSFLYVACKHKLLASATMPGILIIDDNANMRRLLRSFVETNTGFEICGEAENGAEGIERAKQLQPDLILLDLTLPGMLGTEVAAIAKRLLPQVKIVLFTMHADGVNQALAATFNIDVAIAKSDSILTLKDHLTRLLMPADVTARVVDLRKNTKIN